MPRTLGLYDDAAGEAPLTSTILPPSASDDDLESAAAATTDVGGAVYRQQQWHKRDRSTITLAVFLALGTIAGIITLVSTVSSNANLIAELEAALSAQKVETSGTLQVSRRDWAARVMAVNDTLQQDLHEALGRLTTVETAASEQTITAQIASVLADNPEEFAKVTGLETLASKLLAQVNHSAVHTQLDLLALNRSTEAKLAHQDETFARAEGLQAVMAAKVASINRSAVHTQLDLLALNRSTQTKLAHQDETLVHTQLDLLVLNRSTQTKLAQQDETFANFKNQVTGDGPGGLATKATMKQAQKDITTLQYQVVEFVGDSTDKTLDARLATYATKEWGRQHYAPLADQGFGDFIKEGGKWDTQNDANAKVLADQVALLKKEIDGNAADITNIEQQLCTDASCGHGSCITDGSSCTCNDGWKLGPQKKCSTCDDHFVMRGTPQKGQYCVKDPCWDFDESTKKDCGHGTCQSDGSCKCDATWQKDPRGSCKNCMAGQIAVGDICQNDICWISASGQNGNGRHNTCNDHGTCSNTGPLAGRCVCSGHWDEANDCNECKSPWIEGKGDTCILDPCKKPDGTDKCTGNSVCRPSDGSCSCTPGSHQTGTNCDQCTAGWKQGENGNCIKDRCKKGDTTESICGANGICDADTTTCTCAYNSNLDPSLNEDGVGCTQCLPGFTKKSNVLCQADPCNPGGTPFCTQGVITPANMGCTVNSKNKAVCHCKQDFHKVGNSEQCTAVTPQSAPEPAEPEPEHSGTGGRR